MKKMKLVLGALCLGGALYGQDTFSTPTGPNAPEVGSIIPEEVTFSMSTTPTDEFVSDGLDSNFLLSGLETRRYSDFPDEVVLTVYHTPW